MKSISNILLSILTILLCCCAFFSGINFSWTIIIITCVSILFTIVIINSGKIVFNRIYILWLINALIMFFYSDGFSATIISYNIFYLLFLFLCMVVTSSACSIDVSIIPRLLVSFSMISCIIVILEVLLGNRVRSLFTFFLSGEPLEKQLKAFNNGHGFTGLAANSNVISYASMIVLCHGLYFCNTKKRIVKWIIVLFSMITILIIGERSNLFFIPFSFVVTYVFQYKQKKLNRGIKLLLFALAIGILFLLIAPYFYRYRTVARIMETIESFSSGDDISNGRVNAYNSAINYWKQSPLIGNKWFYFYNHSYGLIRRESFSHTHNFILELLCDFGVLGFFAILSPRAIIYFLNIRALQKASAESSKFYKFSLTIQTFFFVDSILHIAFYNVNISLMYYLTVSFFFAFNRKLHFKRYLL